MRRAAAVAVVLLRYDILYRNHFFMGGAAT